jgi:hypothetical protein
MGFRELAKIDDELLPLSGLLGVKALELWSGER